MNHGDDMNPRGGVTRVRCLGASIAVTVLVTGFGSILGRGQPAVAPPAQVSAPIADLQIPAGFRISVFASDLVGARLMTVSPEGVLLVARRRTHEVVALPDKNRDGQAEPTVILTGLTNAHSLAFKGEHLYIATTPAVMRVRWANGAPVGAAEKFVDLPTSTPSLHGSRTIGFGKRRPALRLNWFVLQCMCRARPAANDHPGRECRWCQHGPLCRSACAMLSGSTGTLRRVNSGPMTTDKTAAARAFPPDEINLVEAGKHYGYPFFVGRNLTNECPS